MPGVEADYYDGRSARAHRVTLALDGGRLRVTGDEVLREEPLAALRVSEPMGEAPRLVKFADGAHCEVRDRAGFAALLAASGHRDGWVVRMQARWGWAVAAIVIACAAVAAAYRWGLPAASEWLAFRVPEQVLAQLGSRSLEVFDHALFAPSRLPAARQQALVRDFQRLATPAGERPIHRIVFRDGGRVGANALALPDGTIVVTDQLVALAGHEEEVLAVLAHELGHVQRRHSLRMLIQGSIVGIAVAWYLGDVSNIAAGLPTMLLEAGYSRAHEREADAYAARLLHLNGLPPGRLADMLARLEAAHGGGMGGGGAMDYLASHPTSRERIESLRAGGSTKD